MKILVTGSSGQLGRSLVAASGKHQMEAAGHDRLDITNFRDVHEAVVGLAPHVVINAAAYNEVDRAEHDRIQAYRVNALGPRNLALATASAGIPLVHVSTDYVFNGAGDQPYHEYDQPQPLSAYAASKLAGEEAVRQLNQRHFIVRTAWLFHPSGKNFLNTMLSLSTREQLRVAKDQSGSPTYAPHLATAILTLIDTQAYGTYHMAGQGGTSRYELTKFFFSKMGLNTKILAVPHTEFAAIAARPSYSVLTTIQEPRFILPPWQDGVTALVQALASTH